MNVHWIIFVTVVAAFVQIHGTSLTVKLPKALCIYYGYPSLVNGANGNLVAATNNFKQFDLIVFGDGIWKTTHDEHLNTQTIIKNLNALNKIVYGYVDLGVSTQGLSITQMQQAVQGWHSMGVKGIFWDDAGYDYQVTRTRQSTMIQYCHNMSLNVIMNAWNPDDVMSGTDMQLNSGDTYLLESYLISNGKYQPLPAWKTKSDKCLSYAQQYGIKMACLSMDVAHMPSTFNTTNQFSQAWVGTAIYNFDYFQTTDINFSSSGANSNIVYYFPNLRSSYGTTWKTCPILGSGTNYYRSTETLQLNVNGDGKTWGTGTFTTVSG